MCNTPRVVTHESYQILIIPQQHANTRMQLYNLTQIKHVLNVNEYDNIIQIIADSFALLDSGNVDLAPVVHLGPFDVSNRGQMDDACIKAGSIRGGDHFVIKIATGGFSNNLDIGLPTSDGLMIVFSQKTGQCEGVLLDEGWLTDVRTAAAGAVAAQLLAPVDVKKIGVVGTGIQARFQLLLLKRVTTCRSVLLWGRNNKRTKECKVDLERMGFQVTIATSIKMLTKDSQHIITTTSSTSPLLMDEWVQPGTHITAVGADGIGKQELDPYLLLRANLVVCDEINQCQSFGECSHVLTMLRKEKTAEEEMRRNVDRTCSKKTKKK